MIKFFFFKKEGIKINNANAINAKLIKTVNALKDFYTLYCGDSDTKKIEPLCDLLIDCCVLRLI